MQQPEEMQAEINKVTLPEEEETVLDS